MKNLVLKTLGLSLIALASLLAAPEAEAQRRGGRGESEFAICAKEGGYCRVDGLVEVAYGANGVFVYRTLDRDFSCSNDVFGDPLPKVGKACYVRHIGGGRDDGPGGGRDDGPGRGRRGDRDDRGGRGDRDGRGEQWQFCARENETCFVRGEAIVRYGANGRYATLRVRDSVPCDNRTFGDPIRKVGKTCEVLVRY